MTEQLNDIVKEIGMSVEDLYKILAENVYMEEILNLCYYLNSREHQHTGNN